MTEPAPGNGIPLIANDVPPIVDPVKPDHKASKERPRGFGTRRRERDEQSGSAPRAPRANASKPKDSLPPKRKGQFVEPLETLYGSLGLGLMPFRPMTAQATLENAHNCAVAVDEWAYQNEAVRRIIHKLVTASAFGAVVTAHLPILMALAMESGAFNRPTPEPEDEHPVINPDGSPA